MEDRVRSVCTAIAGRGGGRPLGAGTVRPGSGRGPASCPPCSANRLRLPPCFRQCLQCDRARSCGAQAALQTCRSRLWRAVVSLGHGTGSERVVAVLWWHCGRDLLCALFCPVCHASCRVSSCVPSGLCFGLGLKALRLCPPSLLALAPHSLFPGEAGVRPSAAYRWLS